MLSSNGGLGIYVYVHDGKPFLVFRRLSASFRNREGDTAYSKLTFPRYPSSLYETIGVHGTAVLLE
jgi:hypothetical protein